MYLNFDILFSTTGSIYGREIAQHLGILAERKAVSAYIDAEKMAAVMDTQYAELAVIMNTRAKDIGADAVVGVDFRMDKLDNKLLFSVTGNAVRLKPADGAPEAAEIIPAEEAAIEEMGPQPEAVPLFAEEEPVPPVIEEEPAWKCRKCGTSNEAQFHFCPQCGETRRFDWKCPACGMENLPEYRFCPGCGAERG